MSVESGAVSVSGALRRMCETCSSANTVFVVVPDARSRPEQWCATGSSGVSWLCSPDLRSGGQADVLIYDHVLSPDSTISEESINSHGARLLYQIQKLSENPAYDNCPVVLISHSVGGFILKRAICLAYSRQEKIRVHIAAAVLISIPHTREGSSEIWTATLSRMLMPPKKFGRQIPLPQTLAKSLARNCRDFEQTFRHPQIITVYETRGSRHHRMGRSAKVLVDEELAKTNVPGEKLIGIDKEHGFTCLLDAQDEVWEAVTSCLNTSIAEARAQIQQALALEHSTITSQDSQLSLRESGPSTSRTSQRLSDSNNNDTSAEAGLPSLIPAFSTARLTEPDFPYFVVPHERNRLFYGRTLTLEKMENVLCAPLDDTEDRGVISFALSGQGGIGKTEVAVEFVHTRKTRFDAIFWVPAETIERLHQSFREIAITLGLVAGSTTDSFDRSLTRSLVLGWLARPPKRLRNGHEDDVSWLLVFDNADNPDLLSDFWPQNASGHVLITSKDPLATCPFYTNTKGVTLSEFDRKETSEFLIRVTGRENEEEDKRLSLQFADGLGGIPLVIATMAGVITRRQITFAEFLEEYQDGQSHARLFNTRPSHHLAHGYEHTIASADGLNNLEHGRDLLDVLSFFDPTGIPEDIVLGNKAQTAMGTFPISGSEYQEGRTELLKSSLVTRKRNDKSLTIHRLTQDNARSKMNEGRYRQVFISALQLLAGVWPYGSEFGFLSYESYEWARADELYIHILRLLKLSDRVQPPVRFTPEYLQPLKVLLEAAWFGVMRGDFHDTKLLLELAGKLIMPLETDTEGQKGQPKDVIENFREQRRLYHFYRGCRALHTNEPKESLSQLETFWSMLRDEVIGDPHGQQQYPRVAWNHTFRTMVRHDSGREPHGNDHYLGMAWNELGNAYLQNDDKERAEACFRKSFKIMSAVDGKVTPNMVSMPLINLGFALWLQGRLIEAADVFEEALEYRGKHYGPDDRDFSLGKLYLGYGNVKKDLNDLEASFELHNKCLEQYLKTLGKYHHRIGDGLVRLSDHYVRTGKLVEAKRLLDRACDIYGGHAHFRPEQARAVFKLAGVLRQLRQHEEANRGYQEALELFRLVDPNDKRKLAELTILDFDRPIMFWSK